MVNNVWKQELSSCLAFHCQMIKLWSLNEENQRKNTFQDTMKSTVFRGNKVTNISSVSLPPQSCSQGEGQVSPHPFD